MRTLLVTAGVLVSCGVGHAVDLHGFIEGAHGVRTVDERAGSEYTLNEVRAQIRVDAYDDVGDAFIRADIVRDDLRSEDTVVELREAYFRFTTLGDHVEVKAGRQIATWGTGDLLFINDLFPKDWVSFFTGRDDPYLKAPIDALRLGVFGLPVDLDLVVTPRFTPDEVPTGRTLGPVPEPGTSVGIDRPSDRLENAEIALRVTRTIGQAAVSGYAYRGFYKAPETQRPIAGGVERRHGRLSVVGASIRTALGPGILWLEAGSYHSFDADSRSPVSAPPSTWRALAGSEWQPFSETTLGVQMYIEVDQKEPVSPDGARKTYELVTVRLDRNWRYQTWRTSLFFFGSPEDEDVYVRALVSHQVSDAVSVAMGANVFESTDPTRVTDVPVGRFGMFDADDNVFARLRFSF